MLSITREQVLQSMLWKDIEGILFQMNHVRIVEPASNEDWLTNGEERLCLPVAMSDRSGTIEVRMREKAALELTSLSTKEESLPLGWLHYGAVAMMPSLLHVRCVVALASVCK